MRLTWTGNAYVSWEFYDDTGNKQREKIINNQKWQKGAPKNIIFDVVRNFSSGQTMLEWNNNKIQVKTYGLGLNYKFSPKEISFKAFCHATN